MLFLRRRCILCAGGVPVRRLAVGVWITFVCLTFVRSYRGYRSPARGQVRRSGMFQETWVRYSEVDHVPGEAVESFLQRFAECGVGVDVAGQLGGGQVPFLGEGELGQKL